MCIPSIASHRHGFGGNVPLPAHACPLEPALARPTNESLKQMIEIGMIF
jgi:hypothetical protein